jgi:hypothetical protein
MKNLSKQIQQEAQRGLIVRILVEWRLEWMPFGELRLHLLRRTGDPVADEALQFHLNYLARAGYVETKQLRAARAGLEMTAVRGTPKAVDLVDGRIAEDPGVGL